MVSVLQLQWHCKLSLGFSCVVDLSCGKGCEGFVLSKAKRFEIRGTANGSEPCLEGRAAQYVSWIRKSVINPSALGLGAGRDVSCDIAILNEDERRRIHYLGVLHLWSIGVFTCTSAKRGGSFLYEE